MSLQKEELKEGFLSPQQFQDNIFIIDQLKEEHSQPILLQIDYYPFPPSSDPLHSVLPYHPLMSKLSLGLP